MRQKVQHSRSAAVLHFLPHQELRELCYDYGYFHDEEDATKHYAEGGQHLPSFPEGFAGTITPYYAQDQGWQGADQEKIN